MDKKEIRQKAMEKAIKVVVTSEQVEAALRMGFTRDEDILVLMSLHRRESQRTIEGILNKYSQNVKNKSIWVDNLIQSSNIAKDIAKSNGNYECYVIDESNIHFMRTWADPEPQREKLKKCRPKETFNDKLIDDANGQKLQKIHSVMNGKRGKDAALIILACIKKGWLNRPTYTQVKNEFGDIGAKAGYNKYLNENMHKKEELEGAINSLD